MNYLRKKAGVDIDLQDTADYILGLGEKAKHPESVQDIVIEDVGYVDDSATPRGDLNISSLPVTNSLAPDNPVYFKTMAAVDDANAAIDNAKDWLRANIPNMSAADIQNILAAVRNNPTVTKTISTTGNVKDWIKTHPALSALIGVGGLGLGYGLYNWMSDDEEEEEEEDKD